jgi:hypothetical protein
MTVEEMDKFTLLRWSALLESVNMIYDKAEKNGIPEDKITFKQNHIVRYIDETTERVKVL